MKKDTARNSVLGMVGLFSALVLANVAGTQPVQAASTTTVTAAQPEAAATVADAAIALTNQHANLAQDGSTADHAMGSALSDAALVSATDESQSTASEHVMQAPQGLTQAQQAQWLKLAKAEATSDYQATVRAQKIIQVAATTSTIKRFAIGATDVPDVDTVDVASYQNWMTQANYNTLKQKGVKSAIVKVSEGSTYMNPYAKAAITYAKNAGLQVGVYHYARFNSTATAAAEAQKVISSLQSLGMAKNTRIFADMEDSDTAVASVKANLNQFWATLNAAGYTNHGVYTGGGQGQSYATGVAATVGAANTWYAAYLYTPTASSTLSGAYGFNYGAWQFSSNAYIAGTSGNSIDVSDDYSGVLTNLGTQTAATYDKIVSTKAINLPGTIAQSSRSDGFYSAPYNTDAMTVTENHNAKLFNGQTVQILEEATTSRSAAAGNTFYKVRLVNGKTYWTDTRAIQVRSFFAMTNQKAVNYTARIKQTGRTDGLYPDGPYNTKLSNVYPNTNAPAYDRQIVPVTAEATTTNGTYCQITLNNGSVEWLDKRGLTTDIYDKVTSTTAKNTVARITQAGRSDGLYSAPFATNAATITKNANAKMFADQAVTIIAEAKTSGLSTDAEGNDFYEIRLNNGKTYWINAAGVTPVALDKVTSQKTVDLAGVINESGRSDGLYSAPWNTDALTITENHNATAFDGQTVQVEKEATTSRSATAGNTFYQVRFANGRELWIDARGVKTKALETVTNAKTVNYDAKIVQSGRSDGLYAHPYNSNVDSIFPNTDALAYDGRGVKVTALGTTSQGTYAQVTLPDGDKKWLDVRGLTAITYNQVTSSKTMNATGNIVQSGRADGLYSAPWYTDAMSVLENHNAAMFNGQSVTIIKQATTNRSAVAGNSFYEIQLANGNTYWIDARGISVNK